MTVSQGLNIAVIGAGIGGLSAAIALARAGHNITLYETSKQLREVGAAISSSPNATRILMRWGFERKDFKASNIDSVNEYNLKSGQKNIGSNIPNLAEIWGADWWACHRQDLHEGLRKKAMSFPTVKVLTSKTIANVDPESGDLGFSDGTTATSDLVIGADGIHSVCRKAVLGGDLSSEGLGHAAYRALVPREEIEKVPELQFLLASVSPMGLGFHVWPESEWRFVIYACREGELINMVAIFPGKDGAASENWNAPGDPTKLLQTFESYHVEPRILQFIRQVV